MELSFKMQAADRRLQIWTTVVSVLYFLNNMCICHGLTEEHHRYKREEDTINMTGLWISNGVMIAFVSLIVMYGLYKSYIGKVHVPVRREEDPAKRDDGGSKKETDGELSAVNPTFIDDSQHQPSAAATQTDFPEDEKTEKV